MSSYSHLSLEEREQIFLYRSQGLTLQAIGRAIGRSCATISRELKRHRLDNGGYSPLRAEGRYMLGRKRPAILEQDSRLRQFVIDRLSEGWSPEQISGWIRNNNEKHLRAITTETIYAFIYRAKQKAEKLWLYLTRRRSKRRRLKARKSRDTIKHRQSIHQRDEAANQRTELGHWEADLMICKRTRPLLVLHERKSRVTLATRLSNKSATQTLKSMLGILSELEPKCRKSVTFDNDTTFANHYMLARQLNLKTWFCDAYASWQKGGVENTNGRLRRWLPRHTDLDALSDEDIQDIVITINTTPRKCLDFKTPLQAFCAELGKDIKICFL